MKTSTISSLIRKPLAAAGALAAVALTAFLPLTGRETPKMKFDDAPLAHDQRPGVTFGPVIKRVGPSVVNIYSTKTIQQDMSPLMGDPLLRQFFGSGMQNIPRERREQSLGSGVIVSENGYILTNNHVVANADEVKVGLSDNQTVYTANVIGTDPQTDIAVLKVEAKELPAITLTDSDKVEVGDVVLALGNPFGIGQTVTMGIISAKGRGGMGIVDYEDFIQTDASINPGNSGGALVDAAGRLVGINTAILSGTGGNQGVGFAVPSNLARFVLERIIDGGKVNRGHLGVLVQPITPELARKFDLPGNTGALVGDVTPDSPADEAGIRAGDVLVEFDGRKIADSRQLRLLAAQSPPGTSVSIKLLRGGKVETVAITLSEGSNGGPAETGRKRGLSRNGAAEALDGVTVGDIDSRARQQLEIPSEIRGGALIVNIAPDSPAAIAQLKPGDIILEINRRPVANAAEAIEESNKIGDESVLLRIWSGGAARYVILESKPGR